MMDGNDGNQDLGATFLSSEGQLFVQSDGDGKQQLENFLLYNSLHHFQSNN